MLKFHTRVIQIALIASILEFMINPVFNDPIKIETFGGVILANVLAAYTIAFYVVNGFTKTWIQTFGNAWVLSFTVGSLSILIEAYVFNVTSLGQTLLSLAQGLIHYGFLSIGLSYFLLLKKPLVITKIEEGVFKGGVKILAGSLIYIVIYLAAGMILQSILPELNTFYSGKLPSLDIILYTQVVRGIILSSAGVLFIKTITASRFKSVILLGLIFSILGGIAPLIPENVFMPITLRIGHGFEVGISNLIYGIMLGLILQGRLKAE